VTSLAGEIYVLILILMQEFVTEFYHWRIRAVNGYEVLWRMFALYPELF